MTVCGAPSLGWAEMQALHGSSLHALPRPEPGCPPWVALRALGPSHSSEPETTGTCQLTGHKLQSVALNRAKPNAQALRPEKDFSKPHLTLHVSLPTPLANDSVHTQPSRFYPMKTVTPQTSLSPRARLKPGSRRRKPPSTLPPRLVETLPQVPLSSSECLEVLAAG